MSASLVGSEMCIRDRPGGLHRYPRRCGDSGLGGPMRGPGQPPGTAGGPGAVSYTHLTLPTICSV
eukprot:5490584-Alexandrium_andersonii.AAC.1